MLFTLPNVPSISLFILSNGFFSLGEAHFARIQFDSNRRKCVIKTEPLQVDFNGSM